MHIPRTSDAPFEGQLDWPVAPHHTTITADDGRAIVLTHGDPSWSYLHRHMMAPLAATGRRIIAVDLVGHGRSDKPASKDGYTLARHVDWMFQWLLSLDLQRTTRFCQHAGGTIGLRLVAHFPERFDRVVVSSSGIQLSNGSNWFLTLWTNWMGRATHFPWFMFKPDFAKPISAATDRAPCPTPAYEEGPAKFPVLIAVAPDNPGVPLNRAAWAKLKTFNKPFLTLFSGKDVVARGLDRRMQRYIPGTAGQAHDVMPTAGHFIQEDEPQWLVERIVRFLQVRP